MSDLFFGRREFKVMKYVTIRYRHKSVTVRLVGRSRAEDECLKKKENGSRGTDQQK